MKTERLQNLASMDPPAVVVWHEKATNFPMYWKLTARRILRLGISKGKLLDIACGPGHLLAALARLESELDLCDLDVSPNMLDACRNKLRKRGYEAEGRLVEGSLFEQHHENV